MHQESASPTEKKTSRLEYAFRGAAGMTIGGGIGTGVLALALPFILSAPIGPGTAAFLVAGGMIVNVASPLFNAGQDNIMNALRGGPKVTEPDVPALNAVFNAKSAWQDIGQGIRSIIGSPFDFTFGAAVTAVSLPVAFALQVDPLQVAKSGLIKVFMAGVSAADGAKDIVKGIQELRKSGKGSPKPEGWNPSWVDSFQSKLTYL